MAVQITNHPSSRRRGHASNGQHVTRMHTIRAIPPTVEDVVRLESHRNATQLVTTADEHYDLPGTLTVRRLGIYQSSLDGAGAVRLVQVQPGQARCQMLHYQQSTLRLSFYEDEWSALEKDLITRHLFMPATFKENLTMDEITTPTIDAPAANTSEEKRCGNCARPAKKLTKNLCDTCYRYEKRHGVSWPLAADEHEQAVARALTAAETVTGAPEQEAAPSAEEPVAVTTPAPSDTAIATAPVTGLGAKVQRILDLAAQGHDAVLSALKQGTLRYTGPIRAGRGADRPQAKGLVEVICANCDKHYQARPSQKECRVCQVYEKTHGVKRPVLVASGK